jgi:tRNA nucleotidyltransferase (CCA-adding enzyme)
VESNAEEVRVKVEQECEKAGLSAEVRLDGSVAKDTWINEHVDADIFMRVSPTLTKDQLRLICLPIAKKALKPNQVTERFAEHPYVESVVESKAGRLRVNVVPCYQVQKGEWLSATDRTPFHTEYIQKHLNSEQRNEVRLLKAFLRSIGSYGADIKTGGFSGMLCETLVAAYGEFPEIIRNFREWQESRFIDIEGYYEERGNEVKKIFREPLIVIDPVDKGRNLGSAVRPEQLWNFVAASRHFLEHPSRRFFKEPNPKPLNVGEFKRMAHNRGSNLLCLNIGHVDAVVDILWSQLYRTQRAIAQLLHNNDFEPIRTAAWSDERELNILLFELSTDTLPTSRRHLGPPTSKINESLAFLRKHSKRHGTVAGPWIENDRWVVEKQRTTTSAPALLNTALVSGGARIGVASLIQRAFRKNLVILKDEEIAALISSSLEFGKFMRTYFSGRPIWLD